MIHNPGALAEDDINHRFMCPVHDFINWSVMKLIGPVTVRKMNRNSDDAEDGHFAQCIEVVFFNKFVYFIPQLIHQSGYK
jgi:hypothetical protein